RRHSGTIWRRGDPPPPPGQRIPGPAGRRRYEGSYATSYSTSSACGLRPDGAHRRRRGADEENEPQRRCRDADPDENLSALAPHQEQLADDERAGHVSDALEEAVGGGHRRGTDLARELRVRDVRHHRRVDETMSQADDEDAADHHDRAERTVADNLRSHQA